MMMMRFKIIQKITSFKFINEAMRKFQASSGRAGVINFTNNFTIHFFLLIFPVKTIFVLFIASSNFTH